MEKRREETKDRFVYMRERARKEVANSLFYGVDMKKKMGPLKSFGEL